MRKKTLKRIEAKFFQLESGREPVREWLLSLDVDDRKIVGDDIRAAEFGWPVGMPICRPLAGRTGLWEIRSNVSAKRITRVFFCIEQGKMVLLHAIIKKSQKTPSAALDLAEQRRKALT